MPKVTEQYLAERRAQILEAARTCFLRDGFHAASMQDVFAESGLSAGAVYRYFGSKDEMILAIAEENMRDVATMIRARARGESLGEILAELIEVIRIKHEERGVGGLALQVWAESARNPALRARFTEQLRDIREWLVATVRERQQAGDLPASVDAHALAAVFGTLVPGFMQQLALGGSPAVAGVTEGLVALWPARTPPGSGQLP